MRAFTILFVGAMLGAISLATLGAVSTISQTHRDAIAFRLPTGNALARHTYDGQAADFAVTTITPAAIEHAGKATAGDHDWRPSGASDR